MKAITLRNVPPDVARRIERVARTEGISLNKAAIRLLRESGVEKGREGPPYDDLDSLSGTWSAKEADAFDGALREQRRVDRKMWR